MITHHFSEGMIVEFASGSLAAAETLVASVHVAMCPVCRTAVADFEALGAELLENCAGEPVGAGSLAAVLSRIGGGLRDEEAPARIELERETGAVVPPPIRALLPGNLSDLRWRRTARGISETSLPRYGEAKVSLLRIRAGQRVPWHTHAGNEYTLVLSGGFFDGADHYGPGDVAVADGAVDHAPVADPGETCLCLTVQDGPIRLTGPIGRYLNPLVRYPA